MRGKDFGETKIKLHVGKMGSKPEQDPDNPCDLSESYTSFWQVRELRL